MHTHRVRELTSGLYRSRSRVSAARIADTAAAAGRRCFYLDGAQIAEKAALMDACVQVFELPAYFGRNWDALADCLRDLGWAPADGYLVLYDRAVYLAQGDPAAWETLLAIFAEAAEFWEAQGVPFTVVIRGARGAAAQLPELQLVQ